MDGKTLFLGSDKPDKQNYKGREIDLERATVDQEIVAARS